MGGEDFRSKPLKNDTYTYFIFDNLRCNQDHEGGDVLRYDTIEQAIGAFERIQSEHPNWTIALGGSINGVREIDYIHRRNGDNCLITDYQKLEAFKDSPEVKKAIETAMVALKVDWQVDHDLTGNTILVPHEFGDCPLDSYLFDMQLRPGSSENVLSSVQELFVEKEGWVDLSELKALAHFDNYESPRPPKVTAFNVAYEVRGSHSMRTGYVDVSPSNFRVMKQAYLEAMRERAEPAKDSWCNIISQSKEKAAAKKFERSERPRVNHRDPER